jgi:hypothetical protein
MVTEEELRAGLDENGLLRDRALAPPASDTRLTVFAQRPDARVELPVWKRHAEQFFSARLGLTVDKRYPGEYPATDAARVVIVPARGGEGVRFCYGCPRSDDDLRAAENADARAGNTGLGFLARRCPTVWLVGTDGPDDRAALLIAAILASVVLGPILSADQRELFGVRTARTKLEAAIGPYR